MNQKNILLSICIPTFNRFETLNNTLEKLFTNPDFDKNKIEVIVSDNYSTDNTPSLVFKFPEIKYYRNNQNLTDRNFTLVLEKGNGKYLKLFNDTLEFKPNALKKMLELIENHDEKSNLFFYSNLFLNKFCMKEISSVNQFLLEVSYLSTWIANFGCWKIDFDNIVDKDRFYNLNFLQLDWSFKIVKKHNKTIIFFDDFFNVITPSNKGGYNIFQIFVNNYLFIIKNEKMINFFVYQLEKYRLFRFFIYPWMFDLFISSKIKYQFYTDNFFLILFKKYWYYPYFYLFMPLIFIKKIFYDRFSQ